jgi:3'5'-cyclic nucleotide phosphodiesterase
LARNKDIDHRGVSNAQLAKEEEWMATTYKNKSVAEQNSLDISWSMLMSDRFAPLRHCIFANNDDVYRFRQIIVNVVLATDIFDKELNDLRKARWINAFSEYSNGNATNNDELKATIVIEYIIQASDVSHTMQHWQVFCKWNRRLFVEMYTAFCEGRFPKNPCEFWYEGEIGFFDNYVIPLAKKLRDCNVFGVSSEELLTYAESNRDEWKERGQEIVKMMIEEDVPFVRQQLSLDADE